MQTGYVRRGALALFGAGTLALAMLSSTLGASAGSLGYTVHKVGPYGGEPSITSAGTATTLSTPGELYEASLFGTYAFRNSDHLGDSWTQGATNAFGSTGDDCLATDQQGALYLCNLTVLGPSNAPLESDVYKSTNQGDTWTHSNGITTGTNGACTPPSTSCSEFGVDRPWVDAWIPPGSPSPATNHAEVVLMYHDFYGPSHIWVNISTDGGLNFGPPEDILAHLNPSAGEGDALSLLDTACSTVPAGVKIVQSGPHAGRIYVAWNAADPSSFGTGCNLTQVQAFHDLFVAWSDDGGSTWTPQLAFDGGVAHDMSTPFVALTLDDQGNPYFGFNMLHFDTSGTANNTAEPQLCAGYSTAGTLQSHPECDYDMYVVWSPVGPNSTDGPTSWDGGGGLVPGSAALPYQVNDSATEPGTHVFPAIAAGDPGHVDVAYLRTPTIEPINNSGKFDVAGCAGPSPGTPGDPTFYPPTCKWDLYAAQATTLTTSPPGTAGLWTVNNLTSPSSPTATPMHVGDICNLGLFCSSNPNANRNLADFIMQTIDPTTGCAHIAYADDQTTNEVDSANQSQASGACFGVLGANVPETPLTLLVVPAGLLAAGGAGYVVRRRRVRRERA